MISLQSVFNQFNSIAQYFFPDIRPQTQNTLERVKKAVSEGVWTEEEAAPILKILEPTQDWS